MQGANAKLLIKPHMGLILEGPADSHSICPANSIWQGWCLPLTPLSKECYLLDPQKCTFSIEALALWNKISSEILTLLVIQMVLNIRLFTQAFCRAPSGCVGLFLFLSSLLSFILVYYYIVLFLLMLFICEPSESLEVKGYTTLINHHHHLYSEAM